jgi:hypothetical protein
MPVIGFLAQGTPDSEPGALTAFPQGLRETGYVERQNEIVDPVSEEGHGRRGELCGPQKQTDATCLTLHRRSPLAVDFIGWRIRPGANVIGLFNAQLS